MGLEVASSSRRGRAVAVGWALLPVVVGGFIWLRTSPGWISLLLAQLLFIAPVALAALAAEVAYSIGPPGIERRAWGLLSITAALLLLSEGYYSWYQLTISQDGPRAMSAFDALNFLAAMLIVFGIVQLAGVSRLGLSPRLRLAFDATAFSAVTFACLYRTIVQPLATADTPWWDSARWTVYSLIGVLIIVGILWLVAHSSPGIERRMISIVALAIGIFAIGMLLWPLWRSGQAAGVRSLADALIGAVYLLGYYLLMMAALTRIRESDRVWRITNGRLVETQGVWASTLLSLYVLAGVGLIGWWLYGARGVTADAGLYLASGLVATLGLVARTGVTAIDTVLARNVADIDPVSGALGGVSFLRRCEEAIARAERLAEPLSLIVFDMDGFSSINAALGHAGGDRVLAQVASVVSQTVAGRGEVFRLTADEFAVLCPMSEPHALVLAAEILAVIRGLDRIGDAQLSASVGVAGCEGEQCSREDLVHRANSAQAWAKYHGKGRVVRFEERIVRALGVEERLRVHEDRSGLDMARALASVADARDPRNYYHSRNVAALSVMFSEALDLEPEHVRRIEIAAMLHDCGKLGLVDSLLADVLRTSRQQLAAREHAVLGETLVRSVGMPDVPEWVRHHHERWDGAGYPDALVGERVPLESRIIALADAYDAMTSGARNRSPMSRGAALQEIDLGMGSRFDPMLAEAFIEVVGRTASLGWSDEWAMG